MPTSFLNRTPLLSGVLLALLAVGAQAQPAQAPRAKPPEPIIIHSQVAPAVPVGEDKAKAAGADSVEAAPRGVLTIAPIGGVAAPQARGQALGAGGAGLVTIAPIGAAKAAGAALATDPAALRSSLVLEQLLDGKKSVGDLFGSGELTPEVARYILSHRIEPWGQVDGRWSDGVRRDLAGLVWREGGEALRRQAVAPQVLPRYSRLWLADYLSSVGDEHVIAVGEQILKDTPLPLGGDDGQGDKPLVFQTIERMARYLATRGQIVESAQMWERLPPLYAAKEWWIADSDVEAARMWNRAGQEQRAMALYAQVSQYNKPWFTGLAAWDAARIGIRRGKFAQVAASLSETLRLYDVGGAKLVLLTLLSGALAETGNFEASRTYASQAVALYRAMDETQRQPWMKDIFDKAAAAVQMLDLLERAPLSSPTQSVVLTTSTPKERTQKLSVHSLRPFIVSVSSTCPGVEAKVVADPWEEASSSAAHQDWEVIVTVKQDAATSASKNVQGHILIKSPQFPNDVLRIPVKVSSP